MNLDRLNEFIITARSKSIRKAAETMNIAPATLHARLCSFEASLGISLFERSHSTLSLTPRGARFYIDACEIMEEYSQLKAQLLDYGRYSRHPLRIAVAAGIVPFYLTSFLAALQNQISDLTLVLSDDTCFSISDGLLSEQVDFYFSPVMMPFKPKYEGIVCHAISSSHPQAILPKNHKLASKGSISITELKNEQFVLYPVTKDTCIRDYQLANLKASGITYTLYDSLSLPKFNQTFTAIGKGIFISPLPFLDNIPDSVHVPLSGIRHPATETLFYRENPDNPDVLFFITQFKQHIKEIFSYENRKTL